MAVRLNRDSIGPLRCVDFSWPALLSAMAITSGDRPLQGPNLTYWKSNPYLTSKFTGESDELHPQWVIVDLQAEKPVGAVRITWENPYAVSYRVEYRVGKEALNWDLGPMGEWKAFPAGVIQNMQGGDVVLKLADATIQTRYVRVLMTKSSNTCDLHGPGDIRNCVGYAMREVRLGTSTQAVLSPRCKNSSQTIRPPIARLRSTRGTQQATPMRLACTSTPDSTSSSPAASPTICPQWSPSRCCTVRRTIPQGRLPTWRNGDIRSATSKWGRSRMASTPCQKTMLRFIFSGL